MLALPPPGRGAPRQPRALSVLDALWSVPLWLALAVSCATLLQPATAPVCGFSHAAAPAGVSELLERIVAALSRGGAIFALVVSGGFIASWAVSHLRQPRASEDGTPRVLPYLALASSLVPVVLTAVAVLTRFVPGTLPLTLKVFGVSVLAAALSWSLAVLALVIGGQRVDLKRARAAVVLSGTPWYALTLYLAWLM